MTRVTRLGTAALLLGIVAAAPVGSAPLASAQVPADSKYARLWIAPIEVEPNVELPGEYRGALLDRLLDELRKAKVFVEVARLERLADPAASPLLVLTVRVTSFDPGDRALRANVGLGAGAAKLEVRARFVDARTCVTVLETGVSDKLWAGWMGGDSMGVIKGAAKKVAELAKRMDLRVRAGEAADCAALTAGAPALLAPETPPATEKPAPSALPPDVELQLMAKFDALEAADIPGLEQKAAAGDAEAQFLLGRAYVHGRHVPKDVKKGIALYEQAATQGFRPAQNFLAEQHAAGTNVPQDYAAAFKWWSAAAEQGSPEAQLNLAVMYAQAEGRPKDPTAAVGWMMKAAAQGLPRAQCMVAEAYATGYGVAKNDAEAVKWLQRAAEGGDAAAQAELAGRLRAGDGVPVDHAAAARWALKSVDQGNTNAMITLGLLHEDGRGVARDLEQAVRYFRQAAELGDALGMCYVGDMYRAGAGIGQSDREAYRWAFVAHNARCTGAEGCTFCEATLKAARKRLSKAEREAAERDAKAWAAALQSCLNQPRLPSPR